jgi:biopolymer transport protein ExbB
MSQFLTTKRVLLTVAFCCMSSLGSVATAQSFDNLIEKVRTEKAAIQTLNRERESRFRADLDAKRKLNADVQQKKTAAEARTNQLDAAFIANEKAIEELNGLLQVNQGNLGELFGVTRLVAGDALGVLTESLNNTQLSSNVGAEEEDRLEFMRRMSAAAELPSIVDLERIWLELMDEMKAQTEVARYTAPVLQPDGTASEMEVVRVGPFTAYSEGKYLIYTSSNSSLNLLSRQPVDAEIVNTAQALVSNASGSGYAKAIVDPAQGALLSQYVERPDFVERIQHGQVVDWVIVAVGAIGVLVAAFQYIYLFVAKAGVSSQLRKLSEPLKGNALGRMLLAVSGSEKEAADVVELRISEAVLREIPRLERFQAFLRLAVAAGPLLGLIGTVIGMILTFESITASGSADPKLMAQGIGQAMIATVLGLGIAIPLLFINAGLVSLSKSIIHVLEEQSTSLMGRILKQH